MPVRTATSRMTLPNQGGISAPDYNKGLLWHLVQVKSRQERALADELANPQTTHHLGPNVRPIRYFLPLTRTRVNGSRSSIPSLQPLFPGYMFAYGSPALPQLLKGTHRVASVIRVPPSAQPSLVRELRTLHAALRTKNKVQTLTPEELIKPFHTAPTARILSGPMRNLEVPIVRVSPSLCLVYLEVSILGQVITIDFHPSQLEPLN